MKALSLTIQKSWPMLRFFCGIVAMTDHLDLGTKENVLPQGIYM